MKRGEKRVEGWGLDGWRWRGWREEDGGKVGKDG
jgi:hypothetical protein